MAGPLALRIGDREKLARMASSRAESAALARRARIVLLAVEGRRTPRSPSGAGRRCRRCGTDGPGTGPVGSGRWRTGPAPGGPAP